MNARFANVGTELPFTAFSEAMTTAEESFRVSEFPSVTTPPCLMTGCNPARTSAVVSSRGSSSVSPATSPLRPRQEEPIETEVVADFLRDQTP